MKNKRFLALFLALLLCVFVFAGCGSNANGHPDANQSETKQPVEGATALKVGAGSGEIVFPEAMFPMAEGFTKIHDNPHARVMLFENGEKAAYVSMELVNCPPDCVDIIKQVINEKTGTPTENILVQSTHVFCTPHAPDDADDRIMFNEAVTNAITEATQMAADTLQEAVIGIAVGESAVTANRDIETADGWTFGLNGEGDSDKTLTVIKAESLSGEAIGLIFAYGTRSYCADVSRGTSDREITSDLTGVAAKMLEAEYGAPALFCMTACADQSPTKAAMYLEIDADGKGVEKDLGVQEGLKIAQEMGEILGNDALAVAETVTCSDSAPAVKCGSTTYEWATADGEGEMEILIETLTVGDLALVGTKPEINCITSMQLKEASSYSCTLLMSFVNGDQNYMPDSAAYDKGTAEVSKSKLAQGAAEQFVISATELLGTLK